MSSFPSPAVAPPISSPELDADLGQADKGGVSSRLRPVPTSSWRPPISALVTTYNEADNIAACIESLLWCDEILVVDSFSSDGTVSIARRYDKVRILERSYLGGASQKNWAVDRLDFNWVLILDADERVTPELRREIEALIASASPPATFSIKRKTFFLGREVRYSGWQHDRVVRLFSRGAARYPNRRVHADMDTLTPAEVLTHPMDHHMVDDLSDYVHRISRYANWGAAQLWRDGRRSGLYEIVVRPTWRFLRTYILQRGFLEGRPGLVMCLMQAYGTFLKWSTLWSWGVDAARGHVPQLPDFDDDEATWAWPEAGRGAQR